MAEPEPDFAAPSDEFIRHRWIPAREVEWVKSANAIMLEHGAVYSSRLYPKRHVARWRAERLIKLMVELRLHQRWELRQHVERKAGGYIWAVEYLGKRD
jgi:hypothetical protein